MARIFNRKRHSTAQPQPKIHKETRKPGFFSENFLVSWFPHKELGRVTHGKICAEKQNFHG
jgi:hypothetical protein